MDCYGLHVILGRATAASLCYEGPRELVSRPFRIERDRMAFTVLDYGDEKTRIELRVGTEVVCLFTGGRSRRAAGVVWDVSAWRGEEAVLAAADEDPRRAWGIGIDDVLLFDGGSVFIDPAPP